MYNAMLAFSFGILLRQEHHEWIPRTESATQLGERVLISAGCELLDVGESRDENSRILTVLPLSVYYDVHDQDRLVAVWAVWQVRSS